MAPFHGTNTLNMCRVLHKVPALDLHVHKVAWNFVELQKRTLKQEVFTLHAWSLNEFDIGLTSGTGCACKNHLYQGVTRAQLCSLSSLLPRPLILFCEALASQPPSVPTARPTFSVSRARASRATSATARGIRRCSGCLCLCLHS